MKKLIVIVYFLIGNWLLISTLPYLLLQWQKHKSRQVFESKRTEHLSLEIKELHVSIEANLHWEKPGREFLYQNQMHDVISMIRTEDSLIIRYVTDHKETRAVIDYKKNREKQQHQKLDQSSKQLFIQTISPFILERHTVSQAIFGIADQRLFNGFPTLPFIPPRQQRI